MILKKYNNKYLDYWRKGLEIDWKKGEKREEWRDIHIRKEEKGGLPRYRCVNFVNFNLYSRLFCIQRLNGTRAVTVFKNRWKDFLLQQGCQWYWIYLENLIAINLNKLKRRIFFQLQKIWILFTWWL